MNDKNIISVACGNDHILALSKDGSVYSCQDDVLGYESIDEVF